MRKRILVVEDEEDNMQILRDLLAPGYELVEADNGEKALAEAAKQRPDLILMDIQLPIMDGYEATRRLKADPALRSVPIIAITSYALGQDEARARAAGCDDFVAKPYKLARKVMPLGERVQAFPGNELLRDLPLELDTVETVSGHGFRPSKAQLTLSNHEPQPCPALGAHSTIGRPSSQTNRSRAASV